MRNMPTKSEHSGCWHRYKCNSPGEDPERFAAVHTLLRKHRLQMGSVFTLERISRAEAYEGKTKAERREVAREDDLKIQPFGRGNQWVEYVSLSC